LLIKIVDSFLDRIFSVTIREVYAKYDKNIVLFLFGVFRIGWVMVVYVFRNLFEFVCEFWVKA
jgi:hypothetical protein